MSEAIFWHLYTCIHICTHTYIRVCTYREDNHPCISMWVSIINSIGILGFCLLDLEYSHTNSNVLNLFLHITIAELFLQCPTYECGRIYSTHVYSWTHGCFQFFTMMNNKICVVWCLCFLYQAPLKYILHVKDLISITKLLSRAMKLTYVFIHSPWHSVLSNLFISSLSNSCRNSRILLL